MEMPPIELTEQGNCKELGIEISVMYPDVRDDKAVAVAKSICEGCVVIDTCREWATKHNEDGVWAGLTQRERQNYKRKLQREHRGRNRTR